MDKKLLKDEVRRDEGERLKPYQCTAGKTTIGVGRNLDDRGITKAESDYLLENDIAVVEQDLDKALPWWRTLTDARQRVLANMCFNLGIARLLGFKNTIEFIRTGKYDQAADGMMNSLWAKQVGARATRLAEMMRKG